MCVCVCAAPYLLRLHRKPPATIKSAGGRIHFSHSQRCKYSHARIVNFETRYLFSQIGREISASVAWRSIWLGASCLKHELPFVRCMTARFVLTRSLSGATPTTLLHPNAEIMCIFVRVVLFYLRALVVTLFLFYCLHPTNVSHSNAERHKFEGDSARFYMYIWLNVILLRQIPCAMSLSAFVVDRSFGARKRGRLVCAHPRLCKILANYEDFATIRRVVATTEPSLLISFARLSYRTSLQNMELWYCYALYHVA